MLRLTLWGVRIRLSLLFPAALVILLTIDRSGIPAWCVAASLMHEAGHFLMMFALGSRPSELTVGIFGVSAAQPADTSLKYWASALIALAGPLVNLASFGVIFAAQGLTMPALVHLSIGLFNLLPVEALDGGQALFFLLARRRGVEKAEVIVFAVSLCVIVPLATAGFFMLLRGHHNFSLLTVSLYLGLLLLLKRRN